MGGTAERAGQRSTTLAAIACLVLAGGVLAALGLWRGESLWNTSDGIYALTAREVLHGLGLYGDVAAAQPPPVYLAGAALLGIDDSLTALRAGLELVGLATALLVWLAVLRLTRRPWLAVAAGVMTPLTPVMLHENALLTPETLGAPLLLGLALVAARPGGAAGAGILAALATGTKLSFALPALAILAVSPVRARALAWFAGAGAVLAAGATAVWGTGLWEAIVVAQGQSGATAIATLPGLLAQEAWSALALVAGAALALALRARAADTPLLRTLSAAALGGLALGLTVVKLGSYVNVVQVAEPPLLVLAACGLAWATERGARWIAAGAVAAVLLVAQSGSLLLRPADPRPYTRPLAASGPARLLSADEVAAAAAAARACPPGMPYPGIPHVAFVAGRRAPGDQPDVFILGTDANRRFAERARAELAGACPAGAPVIGPDGRVG